MSEAAAFEEWWDSLPPLPTPPYMADGLKVVARFAWDSGRKSMADEIGPHTKVWPDTGGAEKL